MSATATVPPRAGSTRDDRPALEVRSVTHSYGRRRALDDVGFSLPAGVFSVLLGPNGAGKTTLFSLVSHLFNTQSGSISVFGHDMARSPREALRRIGIVFQARTLDLDLSVAQNLSYHAALHGIGRAEAKRRIAEVLASVDLSDRLRDKARSLSGGQMRRVEIARALLHDPSLLLLDEATVGLDIQSRARILADIRRLVAERGLSVLWATHLIDEVDVGDNVVVLDAGRRVAAGSVSEVLAQTGTATIEEAFAVLCAPAAQRMDTEAVA
jgi:ABC-2 type transport system ATP-binding protein